ncbi:MAG: Nramp family divalent metal transporter [Candidatus Liptonbacteria bacterium]
MTKIRHSVSRFFRSLGPGLITGASDDDPSGIAAYSQAGAQFGYQTLWTALWSLPFMTAIQEMCGRIGLVKGRGLSEVIKEHYGRRVLEVAVFLLLIANTINIGADLGAMASTMQLLLNIPFVWWLMFITTFCIVLEIFIPYRIYAKYLKYLTFSLLAYVATVAIVTGSWREVFTAAIIPHFSFNKEYLMAIVAILGTTISPYLFFWQTSEEVEEEVMRHKLHSMDHGTPHLENRDLRAMRLDTIIGMTFSNIIMLCIIATAAGTLYHYGLTNVQTTSEAAEALRPLAGNFTFLLFALGVIGTGLLAVPILAGSASYALSEAFGWRTGLYRKPDRAPGFYAIISAAIIFGFFINFLTVIPPFKLLYYAAVINGIIAPPLLFIILSIVNNKKIMGRRVNKTLSNVLGYGIAVLMSAAAIALIWMLL